MVVNQLHKIHLVNLLTADSDNLFASVLQLIQQVTRFPYTVIAIEKQGSLWLKSTFNDKIQEVNAQKTFTEYIINNNEPLAVDNINAHELFSNYLTSIRNLVSLNSFIGYPLRDSNGNAYGIIAAFDIEIQPSVHKLIPALQSIANHTQQIFCSQLQKLNSTPQIANFHQQFLNSIIYNKKGGLLVSLDEKGNYLAFTQAYIAFTEKKWGISPLVGEPFSGHLFADNQQEWEQLFIKSLHKQELVFEWSFHTIQKQLIHLQFQVFTYYSTDGQSKNVAVFLTDISRLKNVELALQKQQNLLKQAELISKMGSWEVNLEKKTARFSEGVYEIMGLDKNLLELTLEDAWKFIHPDDLAKAQSAFFNSVNHKQPYFIEKRFVIDGGIIKHIRSSGKVHYNEEGKPEKFVGVFQDITREKMAEEALRFSEERWKYAIEGSNDGIWDWNLAENSIFLSDTGKAIIGFLPEEYVCKPEDLSNRIHPDDFNLFNEAVQNHFTGKAATIFCEYRVKCKDGSFKWVQSKGKIVERNEQGAPLRVVGSHSDIHQRKLTETKLKQNEETLLNIFNFSPVPKLISKVNGGQIVMVNQSLLNISGYEEDELIGKDTMHFYASNEEKELVKDMFAKTGSVKNLELQLKSKNGTLHYCLVSSDVITMNNELMVISGFIDITHLKTLSKALHRSENNIKTILNNTNTGYVLLNTNLNIVTYNEKMYEMVKEDSGAELTIGANALPLFSVEKQPVVKHIFELVKQGQKITREFSQIYANNSTKWFIANFFPVHNNQSEIEAFVMSLEEITERKSVALELEKSFSLVSAQNQRLVNFSYIVSHNLRSHTSNIKSILHFLKLTTDETEKKELLFHLQAVTNSLDDTLYHLNEVVEIQNNVNITVSTIKLLPVIQKSMQLLQNQIALKGACIEVLVNGQITIQHNPAYIESIVLNFLSNAVKYHQPGRKPLVIIEALANKDGGIELSITDNGRGINLQKHGEKLFGMYKTFHDNKDARGIGLFITKNQIEALGGSVNVKSKPHVGTCFTIQFK